MVINNKQIEENHKLFLARTKFYKEQGFDQIQARENILNIIPKPLGQVLEIGSGKGYLTKIIAKVAEHVTSIDINTEDQKIALLNIAYEKFEEKVTFLITNAEKTPFKDLSFDTIVCAYTFHHLENPFKVLKEIVRLCRKNIVITDFNEQGFALINKAHELEGRQHDFIKNDLKMIPGFLEENGFVANYFKDNWQKTYLGIKNI